MDGEDGVPAVVGLVEKGFKFGRIQVGAEAAQAFSQVLLDILAFGFQLEQDFQFLFLLEKAVDPGEAVFDQLLSLLEGAGFFSVFPGFG
jgi:hypothetical protein